ncbi:MAG: hypothetical protein Q8781_02205 [Candidatus Phytoplasma stylosanthis]|uniref:hypothetical protein n=1 Tax=Candidatus Phytoplasma stylosanthis TaxID=2798314 RepID=UPI00293B7B50|nr:hypothetical protein [Candidatus Phytoplasma stylosanthis]MDV3168173.1 hypothetical protein [Candidatus Phytoplasma stylosanthis]MDV3171085.1 hypothetical protein [Candidatus Phytoplasma stylosanthis]MDV3173562.1 hypothetical protein [Candidatus Phytoplasma stylosanthis]MDV3174378.1 hypothetical protein [Candidatus Phytoplasma stylosanthis]MDV3202467.1 hypothetical protein [Candidatus Phytoplasma stylosanthis]
MKKYKFFLKKINFYYFFVFFIFFFLIFEFSIIKAVETKKEDFIELKENKELENTKLKFSKDVIVLDKKKNSESEQKIFFDSRNQKIETSKSEKNLCDYSSILSKKEAEKLLENKYKKDLKQKHLIIAWKHYLGSIFSKKVILFYNIKDVKTISCESFKEWLNFKQLVFSLLEYHIPKLDFLFDLFNISGLKESFIDDKYDKTGLEMVSFYSLLNKNPSLGYFYFNDSERKNINSINISFCNCQISGYSIIDLFFEIINFHGEDLIIFKEHLFNYLKHLSEIANNKNINSKEVDILIEEFIERIIDVTDIELLDKKFLFHLIKTISVKFVPKAFSLHISVDQTNIKPLKEMNLETSSLPEHQTIGFLLKLEKNDNKIYFCFYEIFQDETNNEEHLKLINSIIVLDLNKKEHLLFNHLNISLIQKKNIFLKKTKLYGAKKI